jgi:hypothetical protein
MTQTMYTHVNKWKKKEFYPYETTSEHIMILSSVWLFVSKDTLYLMKLLGITERGVWREVTEAWTRGLDKE